MVSSLDRSQGSKDNSLRILLLSTVLLSGPFWPIVRSLLPCDRQTGHGKDCCRLTLSSLESLEEEDIFPTLVCLIQINPRKGL